MRDIQITTVLNGYIVRVGCQTVVFGSLTDMLAEIRNYLNDPEATEKRYRELPNARWTLGLDTVVNANEAIRRSDVELRGGSRSSHRASAIKEATRRSRSIPASSTFAPRVAAP